MSGTLGLFIESLVALLLVVTIGYCVLVNRKLEQLRSDQSELRQIIRELHVATERAETAIASLRTTAGTAEESVAASVEESRTLVAQLRGELGQGEALLSKLAAITRAHRSASRPSRPTEPVVANAGLHPDLRASDIGIGLWNAQANGAENANLHRRRSAA